MIPPIRTRLPAGDPDPWSSAVRGREQARRASGWVDWPRAARSPRREVELRIINRLALLIAICATAGCATSAAPLVEPDWLAEGRPFFFEEEAAAARAGNAGRPPGKACENIPGTLTARTHDGGSTDLEAAAEAAEHGDNLAYKSDDWRVFATLYGWVPNFKGDVTLAGKTSDVSLTRSDILSDLDIAAMGRVEVMPPDTLWSFWTDIFWASLGDDASAVVDAGPAQAGLQGNIDADLTVRMTFVELAAAYHVWHSQEAISGLRESAPRTQIDVFGGARYNRMRVKVDIDVTVGALSAGRKLDESEDWIDSFIGVRLRHGIAPNWWVALRADVGGFGIGTSSDRAWTATGTIQHMIHEDLSIGAGWKTMDLDYDRGKFEADVRMGGPFVTLTYEF